MKRLDRANIVRDTVLALPREQWSWVPFGDGKGQNIEADGYEAFVYSAFSVGLALPEPENFAQALVLQRRSPLLTKFHGHLGSGSRKSPFDRVERKRTAVDQYAAWRLGVGFI